jgi:hypothetical protein
VVAVVDVDGVVVVELVLVDALAVLDPAVAGVPVEDVGGVGLEAAALELDWAAGAAEVVFVAAALTAEVDVALAVVD